MIEGCQHEHFEAHVEVSRLTDDAGRLTGFAAEVRIHCGQCGERFVFRGAPVGMTPAGPAMSPDGTELRVPILPQSADPHFGLGLPGFVARVREADEGSDN